MYLECLKVMARAKEPWSNDSTSPEDRRLKLLILDVPSKSLATPILTFSIRQTTVLKLHGKGTVRGVLLAINEQFF